MPAYEIRIEKILFRVESHVVAKAKSLKAEVNLNSRD